MSPWVDSIRRNAVLLAASVFTLVVVMVPWIRNRGLLRDFFDYGYMMVASGRLAAGERPFVDFVSPLQTLTFRLNAWADQVFGGTFQALTMGNAVLLIGASLGLLWVLRRRFSIGASALVTAVIVVGSAGQHTIIWYNSIGVLLLAAIAWSSALAPVLRRGTAGWHLLLVMALILSGMNKLNTHAIAVVVAIAWPVRAGLLGEARWSRVVVTVLAWLTAATVVPLAIELQWTGATFELWRYNVIETAFVHRGGLLYELASPDIYLRPIHDFYEAHLRPLGAILIGWLIVVIAMAWRGRKAMDRGLLVAAAVFAVGGMAGLMATNFEIGYVSLSAGMVLLVGLWLGFDLGREGWRLRVVLLLPMGLLGAVFWHSAWVGQRSLFGFSDAPRESYRELRDSAGTFAYLRGVRIPPETAEGLEELAGRIGPVEADETVPYFFGAGTEWLRRIWKTDTIGRIPIPVEPLGYGAKERKRLEDAFDHPSAYQVVVGMTDWPDWPGDVEDRLDDRSRLELVGPFRLWHLHPEVMAPGLPPRENAIMALNIYGGNLDARLVVADGGIKVLQRPQGRRFLGVGHGHGSFRFGAPVHTIGGEVVLIRSGDGTALEAEQTALFELQVIDLQTHAVIGNSWSQEVTLPAGETEISQTYTAATQGQGVRFQVTVANDSDGKVLAGWLMPRIQLTASETDIPPRLRAPGSADVAGVDRTWSKALLPSDWDGQVEVVVRKGHLSDGRVWIEQGGELWFRAKTGVAEWHGTLSLDAALAETIRPYAHVVWYNGGRVELLSQSQVPNDSAGAPVRAWSPEGQGWFGLIIDDAGGDAGVSLKIERMTGPEAQRRTN